MKLLIFCFSFVLISHEVAAQLGSFSVCPADIPKKVASAPKVQTLYQVVRPKKDDAAKCYRMEILTPGGTVQITQSMTYDGIGLDHKYVAAPNVNGTWDVKMNSK
jgi:hypothetical protein